MRTPTIICPIIQGDFVDRGYYSLETFTILMVLKARFVLWLFFRISFLGIMFQFNKGDFYTGRKPCWNIHIDDHAGVVAAYWSIFLSRSPSKYLIIELVSNVIAIMCVCYIIGIPTKSRYYAEITRAGRSRKCTGFTVSVFFLSLLNSLEDRVKDITFPVNCMKDISLHGLHTQIWLFELINWYVSATDECQTKYGNANVWKYCCSVFDYLTLAAVSSSSIIIFSWLRLSSPM